MEQSKITIIAQQGLSTRTLDEAQKRHSLFYGSLVQSDLDKSDLLDPEFAQIQIAIAWLLKQTGLEEAQVLLDFVRGLAPYLQSRGLNNDLLNYADKALNAAQQLGINPGWVLLLKYESCVVLGQWSDALDFAQAAIESTKDAEPKTYARAVLALGRLQFNRGQYGQALPTLNQAENLLSSVGDLDGVITAKAEVAAYYLNRNEHKKALKLYQEVDRLWRQSHSNISSEQSLMMLGVLYRRLNEYEKSMQSLNELIQRGEAQRNHGAIAAGKHHLAWTFFDLRDWGEAKRLGREAKELFDELNDPRGSSDADEQLGLICLAERDFAAAEKFLTCSLTTRQQLANQQGAASSLRRLGKLHLIQGHWQLGLHYLWQSISLFRQLRVLSTQRIFRIMCDLFD